MLPLEAELSQLFPENREGEIAAAYYGIDGAGVRSYRAIGEQTGVTRSRIHQIVRDYELKYSLRSVTTPTLDTVIDVVKALTPGRKLTIEATLQARGLTRGLFQLECILKIAGLLGRNLNLQITQLHGTAVVHPPGVVRWRGIQQVRATVRYWGAARIDDVGRWIATEKDSSWEFDRALLTILSQKDFRWLNQDSGWFWFAEVARNRVVSRIRKMVSLTPEMDIQSLRSGLAKMALARLPDNCLLELCRQLEGISVCGNRIVATDPISPFSVLSHTEQVVFELISENGGEMAVGDLEAMGARRGVTRPTLYQCLMYSPIVIRLSAGNYALLDGKTQGAIGIDLGSAANRLAVNTIRGN